MNDNPILTNIKLQIQGKLKKLHNDYRIKKEKLEEQLKDINKKLYI